VFGSDYEADRRYDLIVTQQTLEHLINPREDLHKMDSLLKPSGILYADVPNWNTIRRVRCGIHCLRDLSHYNYFTDYTLRRMAESVGFEIPATAIPVSTSQGVCQEVLRAIWRV
jgi:2-polyprenyl-3-methyl-5-hydroxy-6-metoxy-1,4-benzoquinol methylase